MRAINESQSPFDATAQIYGMVEYGLMTSDRDFLYFVDRFNFFAGIDFLGTIPSGVSFGIAMDFLSLKRMSGRFMSPWLADSSRLRRGDGGVPRVAWQIGDGQSFAYEPLTKMKSLESSSSAILPDSRVKDADETLNLQDDNAEVDQTWSGHRFLSPPTGQGTRLFVLTQNDTQIFLNCLYRNTGSLLWQQPLAYTNEQMLTFADRSFFTSARALVF